jgi:PAS domain S-box-containing protein
MLNIRAMPNESHMEAQRRELRLQGEAALLEGDVNFHLLADSIPQLAWMAHADGWVFWYNKRWYNYTGTTLADMEGWGWRRVHHPDHVERVVSRVQRAWETGEPWEDTFPLKSREGTWRWFLSRALPVRNDAGDVIRWFGTNTDITELREAEDRQKLLLDELNHRVKNTLAAVQSLAKQTAQGADTVESFTEKFDSRLMALSRAHGMLARGVWQGAGLREIIAQAVAPYAQAETPRIAIAGPPIRLGPTAAVSLGMAVHELVTNAAKYGALSVPQGRVEVGWDLDLGGGEQPSLEFIWKESDGPRVVDTGARGFGTRLVEESVARELSGEVSLDLAASGAVCRMRLPLSRKVMIG